MEFVVLTAAVALLVVGLFVRVQRRDDGPFKKVSEVLAEPCDRCEAPHPAELTPELARRFLENMCGPQVSQRPGPLTRFEFHWLKWRVNHGFPSCIDCEEGDLIQGPSGGISMNVRCNNKLCGSEFNVHGGLAADRLTVPSPNKPREMTSLGPHR